MVAVLHGPDPMTSSGARKDPVRKAIIRRALGRVDALVAVGMPVPLDLPPHLRGKTTVTENGLQPDVFVARDVCARSRMAACRRWPRATWTIIGDGPQRSRLESLRNSLGLTGSVHFAGRLSPTDVAARFAESDLFVVLSRRDAFGCVYLEAMSVHDHDDATEIIAKAERVLSDVEAYENAVELSRKLAQRYTWDAHAHRLRDVLEKVVGRRRGDASCDLSGSRMRNPDQPGRHAGSANGTTAAALPPVHLMTRLWIIECFSGNCPFCRYTSSVTGNL
jgi:Glycosyl transferases group 1